MPIPGDLQSPELQPLPDVDRLIHEVLSGRGVKHVTELGQGLKGQMPICVAWRFGGAAPHPVLLDSANVITQCWAANKVDAWTLAATVRLSFYEAWRKQRVYPSGKLNSYAELSAPAELREEDQPDNTFCYAATYEFRIRPIS